MNGHAMLAIGLSVLASNATYAQEQVAGPKKQFVDLQPCEETLKVEKFRSVHIPYEVILNASIFCMDSAFRCQLRQEWWADNSTGTINKYVNIQPGAFLQVGDTTYICRK